MREGALYVNAGRGATTDTAALVAALHAGRIRAVLDVVDPEPLPSDHPLWTAPGVMISPHSAGDTPGADRAAWALAASSCAATRPASRSRTWSATATRPSARPRRRRAPR